jgi:hypothetical protein
MPFTDNWTPAIKSEYGGVTAPIREYVEPERPDPKLARISLSAYLKQTGWTVEFLDHAIETHRHPRPIGRAARRFGLGDPVYDLTQIATWRERFTADLRTFGFIK